MRTSLIQDERLLTKVSATILGTMILAVAFSQPGHSAFLPPCPLHALTGFFCPGCGSTRALYLLVHGRPFAALGENALAVTLLPVLIYEMVAALSRRLPVISTRLRPWAMWTILATVVLFGILRNVPVAPINSLAPADIP